MKTIIKDETQYVIKYTVTVYYCNKNYCNFPDVFKVIKSFKIVF